MVSLFLCFQAVLTMLWSIFFPITTAHICACKLFFYVIVLSRLQNLIMHVEIILIQPFKLMLRRTSPFTSVEVLSFFAEFIYAVYLIYSSCVRGADPTCHSGTCFCSRSATAWIEWSWSMTAVWIPDTRCLLSNSRTLRSLIKTLCYRSGPARHTHTHTRVIELCVFQDQSHLHEANLSGGRRRCCSSQRARAAPGVGYFLFSCLTRCDPYLVFPLTRTRKQVEPLKATSWKVLMLDTCAACAKVSPPVPLPINYLLQVPS